MIRVAICINADSFSLLKDTTAAAEEEPTETTASQKREDRLRKFRELHFKRVRCRALPDSCRKAAGYHSCSVNDKRLGEILVLASLCEVNQQIELLVNYVVSIIE